METMGRLIPVIIFIFLFAAASLPSTGGVVTLANTTISDYVDSGYRGGMSFHVGEVCVACHTRFSKDRAYANELPYNVSNNAVLHIFPCSKPACHINNPPTKWRPKGTKRWDLHLKICVDCHPRWNTSIDTIHKTHLNFDYLTINRSGVSCDLCHSKPLGYNSSIVRVPPWPAKIQLAPGQIVKPDWKGDCAYCHFTIKGAARVHDVHKPVLLKACPVCHSQFILDSPSMFNRINFPFPIREVGPPTLGDKLNASVPLNATIITPKATLPPGFVEPLPIISEFYLYFNAILLELLDLYKSVV